MKPLNKTFHTSQIQPAIPSEANPNLPNALLIQSNEKPNDASQPEMQVGMINQTSEPFELHDAWLDVHPQPMVDVLKENILGIYEDLNGIFLHCL